LRSQQREAGLQTRARQFRSPPTDPCERAISPALLLFSQLLHDKLIILLAYSRSSSYSMRPGRAKSRRADRPDIPSMRERSLPHPASRGEKMQKSLVLTAVCAAIVAGCAAPGAPRMSEVELIECLQPNRRVVVEVGGVAAKPPPKPKPGEAPPAKPPKPAFAPAQEVGLAQGNHAWDPGSAALKEGGRQELDAMMARVKKRAIKVNSIIIAGHTDRIEDRTAANLSEQRAVAVRNYLVERGLDEKLMFWEGKGAREPVAVTKFCE
jgi:hypothetical protein